MHRLRRINIIGAAGSGVSTLGRALAQRIGGEHFDTDDFCWLPTDPPFRKQREISERLKLLEDALRGSDRWVLSGSLTGWGEAFVPLLDLVVFLYVPTGVRLQRLRVRERERFGRALDPGRKMHEQHQAFLDWAAGTMRAAASLARFERMRHGYPPYPAPYCVSMASSRLKNRSGKYF